MIEVSRRARMRPCATASGWTAGAPANVSAALVVIVVVPLALLQVPNLIALAVPGMRAIGSVSRSEPELVRAAGLALPAMLLAAPTAALAARRARAWPVLLVGLTMLGLADVGANLPAPGAHMVRAVAVDRAAHGLGAGTALAGCLALVWERPGLARRMLACLWSAAAVATLMVSVPLIGSRVAAGGWRAALQPYPWLTGAALAATAAHVALTGSTRGAIAVCAARRSGRRDKRSCRGIDLWLATIRAARGRQHRRSPAHPARRHAHAGSGRRLFPESCCRRACRWPGHRAIGGRGAGSSLAHGGSRHDRQRRWRLVTCRDDRNRCRGGLRCLHCGQGFWCRGSGHVLCATFCAMVSAMVRAMLCCAQARHGRATQARHERPGRGHWRAARPRHAAMLRTRGGPGGRDGTRHRRGGSVGRAHLRVSRASRSRGGPARSGGGGRRSRARRCAGRRVGERVFGRAARWPCRGDDWLPRRRSPADPAPGRARRGDCPRPGGPRVASRGAGARYARARRRHLGAGRRGCGGPRRDYCFARRSCVPWRHCRAIGRVSSRTQSLFNSLR